MRPLVLAGILAGLGSGLGPGPGLGLGLGPGSGSGVGPGSFPGPGAAPVAAQDHRAAPDPGVEPGLRAAQGDRVEPDLRAAQDHRVAQDHRAAQDHRDDLVLNGISGGDFRGYVSDQVRETDRWAQSLRIFGTFHNLMHEMMSELARYGVEELGHASLVPAFENRISGGEWRSYREALEEEAGGREAGAADTWIRFVQVTEMMHDRVHQAMVYAVARDLAHRGRGSSLSTWAGDRAPHAWDAESNDRRNLTFEGVSREAFRALAWHEEAGSESLHRAMQHMMVFAEMLQYLMGDWASIDAVADPGELEWARFFTVAGLMHDRVHQMMAWMIRVHPEG